MRQIDQFVSSSMEHQRKRGCLAVHEILLKFQMVCATGYCALGCHAICVHNKQIDRTLYGNFSKLPCKYVPLLVIYLYFVYVSNMLYFIFIIVQLPAAFVLPSREAMCLGDRVIMYLPRCIDTNPEVRKISAQVSN